MKRTALTTYMAKLSASTTRRITAHITKARHCTQFSVTSSCFPSRSKYNLPTDFLAKILYVFLVSTMPVRGSWGMSQQILSSFSFTSVFSYYTEIRVEYEVCFNNV
jgi:hypothetical protein